MHKLILGSLILLGALIIACGGDGEESMPAATEEPSDEATATESAGGDGGEQTFSSSQLPVPVTVTVPEGWEQPSDADSPDLFAVINESGPATPWVDFLQPTQVYNYPSETQSELGEPPADYVAWFNENPFLTILGTEDVTVGGLSGTRLEITHKQDPISLFKLSDGSDYHMSYLDHIYAHVLNANGSQIIVSCGVGRAGNFEEFAQTCEEILETVEFGT